MKIWDGLDNSKRTKRAVAKRLTMKRLSSCSRATPVHENCRRRNICYRNCIFLGDTERLLAIDDRGGVDIIRPSNTSLRNPPRNVQVANEEPATVDSFQAIDWNETMGLLVEERFGLFSLKDGKAFALTLPGGGLKICDTETKTSFEFSKDPKSFGLAEAHPGRIGQHFNLHGWVVRGPLRAAEHLSSISIHQQASTYTELTNEHPPNSYNTIPQPTGWDLRESPILNAVQIGHFRDTFAFRFFDERTSKHHNIVNMHANAERHDLRDVCYCSDNSVATATDVSIMLWDIRMLRNNTTTIQDIAFPNDVVHPTTPSVNCEDIVKGGNAKIHKICCLDSGNVLALTKSGYQVIDPRRNQLLQQSKNIIDCNCVSTVDSNFGLLALYHPEPAFSASASDHQIIELYDVYQRRSSRKRKQNNDREIVTSIVDEETETSTLLTSLSFNSRGDSLVGSSIDGNVFLFN